MNTPLLPVKCLALDLLLLLMFSHWVVSDSFATPWTIAHQASQSIGFPRQENYSGLPFPSPDRPSPGTELTSPALTGRFFTTEPPGKPIFGFIYIYIYIMLPAISVNDGLQPSNYHITAAPTVSSEGTQDRNRMPAISPLATEAIIPHLVYLKDSGWESRGYWPQIAEVHIKEIISMSTDFSVFPYIDEH